MPVTDRVGVIVLLFLAAGSAGVDSVALFVLCRSNCLALYPAVTLCRDSFSVPVSASTSVNSLAICCACSFLCYLCGVAVSV